MQALNPCITGAVDLSSAQRIYRDRDAWIIFPDKASQTANVRVEGEMLAEDCSGCILNCITAAHLCCSVKANRCSKAIMPTYYPLPYPQLLRIVHETVCRWLLWLRSKDQPCQVWSIWDQWPRSGKGVKYTAGVTFFFFYSLTRPQTKRGGLDDCWTNVSRPLIVN